MKNSYQLIAPLMQDRGINKSDLARIAGVGTSAVTKWVHGGAIRIAQLSKIAAYFGVDVHDIMPYDESLKVRESENAEVKYWKDRALAAEDVLRRVRSALDAVSGYRPPD